MCEDQPGDLENLATVMTLYSRRTFAKDVFQWTKCVVKYLHDVYAAISDAMIAFLVEVSSYSNLLVPRILNSTLLYWSHVYSTLLYSTGPTYTQLYSTLLVPRILNSTILDWSHVYSTLLYSTGPTYTQLYSTLLHSPQLN